MKISFPLIPILGLIFITLKLCGVIAWAWWWVLAPFWLGLVVLLVIVAMYAIFAMLIVASR